jgi:hypothetical protein
MRYGQDRNRPDLVQYSLVHVIFQRSDGFFRRIGSNHVSIMPRRRRVCYSSAGQGCPDKTETGIGRVSGEWYTMTHGGGGRE